MENRIIKPDKALAVKYAVMLAILGLPIIVLTMWFGYMVGLDADGASGARVGLLITGIISAVWFVPLLIFFNPYYRSLRYELLSDEIIVHSGVIFQSVKHVPFRTVTNIEVRTDPLDRIMGIGKILIQTAGKSAESGAEERLAGLNNTTEIYDLIAARLRSFRGAMPPTAAGEELHPFDGTSETLASLLEEVRGIREELKRR